MMQETSDLSASGTSRRMRPLPEEDHSSNHHNNNNIHAVGGAKQNTQTATPRSRPSAASSVSSMSSVASYVSDYTTDSNHNTGLSMGDNNAQMAQLTKSLRNEHKRLSEYEAQRRSTYSTKLESTSLYFKSLVDLSAHSIAETARAQRMVVGMAMAHQQYANGLVANQEQYAQQRNKTSGETKEQRDEQPSLLSAWEASNAAMAAQFQENADFIQEQVATVLRAFLDAVQDQKDQLESVGNPILTELEDMEKEVQQAWDAYFRVATESLKRLSGNDTEIKERQFASPPTMVGGGPEEGSENQPQQQENNEREDLWIVKMQYQVIVSQQIETWENRGTELARMSAASKEMECARRINVQKCMGKFLESLQILYQNLSSGEGETIATNAAEAMANAWKPEDKELDAPFWLEEQASPPTDNIPMESRGLVTCTKVLQWKMSTDTDVDWKAALAVVTVDAFLHLFDLMPYAQDDDNGLAEPGSDPNAAMAKIFPHLAKQRQLHDDDDAGLLVPPSKLVVPEKSQRLTGCSISIDEKESICEISEMVQGTGARLFAKKAVVVLQLRLKSGKPQDLSELHRALLANVSAKPE